MSHLQIFGQVHDSSTATRKARPSDDNLGSRQLREHTSLKFHAALTYYTHPSPSLTQFNERLPVLLLHPTRYLTQPTLDMRPISSKEEPPPLRHTRTRTLFVKSLLPQ
ncbi:hypothetical protein PM082_015868 [Marasmius tenuissimus]|nr:hypothetical protein PM082_015868 [Marasmius tenuissimus]